MGLLAIGQGLKTRLLTIPSFKGVYAPDELPVAVNMFPSALIIPTPTDYHRAMPLTKHADYSFRIPILMARQDQAIAFGIIATFIANYGDTDTKESVIVAIEADRTLGGVAGDTIVRRNSGFGKIEWGNPAIPYYSTEFIVEVKI